MNNDYQQSFRNVDVHVEGEPLRIVTGGLPEIKGQTQLERWRFFSRHHLAKF